MAKTFDGDETASTANARESHAPWFVGAVLAVLCVQFAVLALIQAWRDSPTSDESFYIAAGVTAITERDLRLNPEHPPLAKVVTALPVLLANPVVPSTPAWVRADTTEFTQDFAAAQGPEFRSMVFLSRLVPIALTLLTGLTLYCLTSRLFGRTAGLLSAGSWLTIPAVVGIGHLNGLDIPFALLAVAVSFTLVRYISSPSRARAVGIGVLLGTALLVSAPGVVLAGAVIVVFLLEESRRGVGRAIGRTIAVAVIAWAVLWVGYRAIAPAAPPPSATASYSYLLDEARDRLPVARPVIALLPEEYVGGALRLATIHKTPGPAFLLGRAWEGRMWWYWPAVFAIKLPISTIILLLGGVAGWRLYRKPVRRQAVLALVVPATALTVVILTGARLQGIRYMLPVIALLIPLGAKTLAHLFVRRITTWAVVMLIGVQLFSLWESYPHSIAWTAPPFRPGYQVASDSNLDWGQDLYALEEWAAGKAAFTSYFGPIRNFAEGSRPLLEASREDISGWVAASATHLTVTQRDLISWLRAYCPLHTIGDSILVYRILPPVDFRPGPAKPVAPCAGRSTSIRLGR